MKVIVFLLVAAAAAATVTGGWSRRALSGVERLGDRVWATSSGVTVVCGSRRRWSLSPAPTVELQVSAVLDSVCRYLVSNKRAAAEDANAETEEDKFTATDIYQSVRYNIIKNDNK